MVGLFEVLPSKFLHSTLTQPKMGKRVMWHRSDITSLYLNCQRLELHGLEVGAYLLSVDSYVESLVLLYKAVDVRSESDIIIL
ncbi:hypothetical protein V6N11_079241 [Hibiscus sabdariffa]|uniref:Uncharacterized protein n=1 Tax=Hibiscus sabdariffa TaxID=183260 RepID=A0ABR2RVM6_9ROSI